MITFSMYLDLKISVTPFVPLITDPLFRLLSASITRWFPPISRLSHLTLRRHYCGQVTKFIFFDQNGEFKHIIHM